MSTGTIAVAFLWLVAGPPNFPNEEEQESLSKPYSDCLAAAAERLDDGQSDIAVIGRAVVTACKVQFEEVLTAMGRNLGEDDQQKLRGSLSSMEIGFGTVAVGTLRARQRGILPK